MEWQKGNFTISTDKSKLNIDYIHRFLSHESYWAADIPPDIVQKSIDHSLCFGMYEGRKQIGFARIITDQATFGYLADVFIDVDYRGKELSKWLMQVISELPFMPHLRRLMLATKDAHGLYKQFGFTPITFPERFMQVHRPDVYQLRDKKREGEKEK
jgi:GNAT superfamily N-acetyltransferase